MLLFSFFDVSHLCYNAIKIYYLNIMKKTPFLWLSMLALLAVPSVAQAASFPDLYDLHPNEEAIAYLKQQGIVQGNPDGKYHPEDRINRAAFTKILVESIYSDEEINKCTTSSFSDVPTTEWYAKYVCLAAKQKIVSGYPDGTFKPADAINFVEAAKILAEANKITGSVVGTNQEWYAKYVKGLEEKKAIPSSVAFFDEEITRGEMAEMAYRIKANKTDKVSNSYQELSQSLPTISSCPALQERMLSYLNRPVTYEKNIALNDIDMVAEEPSAAANGTLEGKSGAFYDNPGYSQTNVQVEGVDEADIIKNDGKYIYLLKDDTVRIVQATPANDLKEVAKISLNQDEDNREFFPQDMYVAGDRLVVIGRANNYYIQPYFDTGVEAKIMPPSYLNDQSRVYVFDLTDRQNPKQVREVTFDGNYQTSRRIGNQVYLVLQAYPNYWNWKQAKSGKDFLPMMKDGDKAAEPMVDCTGVRYFPGYAVPQYLMTASVDLSSPTAKIDREVMLGNSGNVYASATDLFVAGTFNDYNYFTDWDWSKDTTKSHIYRFTLKNGDISFAGRGVVPGRSLNQFSMDQQGGYFRIATTTGNIWGGNAENTSKNNVYVLDSNMTQVGQLEGLAPGEQIRSTRFMGNRLYMVTFEQVDPLFVIDMKDARAPKVLGELKVPGFSEYLHPYDETHLIGFGRETSLDEKDNVMIEGFKMSLFDVSDVKNPKEVDKEVIGDSGTYSEILYNHKALLFDKEKNILSFPIQIQELVQPEDLKCSEFTKSTCPYNCMQACVSVDGKCADVAGSCVAPTYEQYQTAFSGALVYGVNPLTGFTEKGRISNMDQSLLPADTYWEKQYQNTIQRILYIGDYLYTVAQGSVKSSNLSDLKEVDKVELEGGYDMTPMPVDLMTTEPMGA